MENRRHRAKWPINQAHYFRAEEEISSVDYEESSDQHPLSEISSFIQLPNRIESSKENVELSLEVEIADSLKHLIASPEKIDSPVLDVTIVRPTDLNCVQGLENTINSSHFRNSDVRNLIAMVERQKQHKKRLIEECRKRGTTNEIKPNPIARRDDYQPLLPKRRLKRDSANYLDNQTTGLSAPIKNSPYKLDKPHAVNHIGDHFSYRGKIYPNSTPIGILHPLVGEIKESLKNLEVSIGHAGDRHVQQQHREEYFNASTSDSINSHLINFSRNLPQKDNNVKITQQIYAAADTRDKLRNILVCQNQDRHTEDAEKPCMCQHCGMVGLLVESQKRPIVPVTLEERPKGHWASHETPRQGAGKNGSPKRDENCFTIREIYSRLEALENRVAVQEKRSVPKDYFKRIINKLWHKQNSTSQHEIVHIPQERNVRSKDTATQLNRFDNMLKKNKEPKVTTRRDAQIQNASFSVNPVLTSTKDNNNDPLLECPESETSKHIGIQAVNMISDFFTKKSESRQSSPVLNKNHEKSGAVGTFWRWGEEIIKPGFDLKTKILTLLDEQFHKHSKGAEAMTSCSKAHLLPNIFDKNTTTGDINQTKPISSHESKKAFTASSASSTGAFRKMLDMMSEKIYNDHVKPKVEAIKLEQDCFNTENSKEINNIKQTMNAALSKINKKEQQLKAKTQKEWCKDFLEPLQVPSSLKRPSVGPSRVQSKTSSIPIRVSCQTNSIYSDEVTKSIGKKRSLIPRLTWRPKNLPPVKEGMFVSVTPMKKLEHPRNSRKTNEEEKTCYSNRGEASGRRKNSSRRRRRSKHVHIKYVNPKVARWNEESCGTLLAESSGDVNQVMLTDKTSRGSSKCERLSDKLAILSKITEMGKSQIWSKILKEAKDHCKSNKDTVVIQIPFGNSNDTDNSDGLTEVEFSIDDIQQIVDRSKFNVTKEELNNVDPFLLLLKNKRVLKELYKRLENSRN